MRRDVVAAGLGIALILVLVIPVLAYRAGVPVKCIAASLLTTDLVQLFIPGFFRCPVTMIQAFGRDPALRIAGGLAVLLLLAAALYATLGSKREGTVELSCSMCTDMCHETNCDCSSSCGVLPLGPGGTLPKSL